MGFFEDDDEERGATFAGTHHRYLLWRVWNRHKPRAMVIGINPSIANDERDDPTMKRVRSLLTNLGYGGFTMVNLYDFVTPYPVELVQAIAASNLWGPDHDEQITEAAKKCHVAVAAWGAHPLAATGIPRMLTLLDKIALPIMCFGLSKGGYPRHPLYLPSNTKLIPFERGER